MNAAAVFLPHGERFVATELARGPWDPAAQHGGAPAALLMRAFERLPAAEGLLISRVTYELLRPVPLGELVVEAQVVRPGRRVQLLEGSLVTPDGTEVVRARALQVRRAVPDGTEVGEVDPPPPPPDQGTERAPGFVPPHQPTFFPGAIEIRFVAGRFGGGPATGWFRLRVPIVAGEEPSALQRLAAAADFGNGISSVLPWDGFLFINPDLTIYVDRAPVGEWVCLQARTIVAPGGVGTAESVLYDERGRVGRAIQSLLVARR
jgi:hypothetical protein